jgi:hypothetical protein
MRRNSGPFREGRLLRTGAANVGRRQKRRRGSSSIRDLQKPPGFGKQDLGAGHVDVKPFE